ncbi:MAG TPA: hypothetical protein VE465_29950 [Streptosporangiaceae bacterium]|jgi:hypothetical protein|nr:hypothetical protein [Streptosporangiaceae bacterium]
MDQLIPELAIGVAAGDERARLLGHLARCTPCRGTLVSASAAADSLLLLAPEREPPPGFETRVLGGLTGETPREAHGLSALPPTSPGALPGALPSTLPSALPDAPPAWPSPPATFSAQARSSAEAEAPLYAEASSPAGASPYAASPHRVRPSSRAGPRTARWRRTLLRLATTVTIAGLVGGALWWRTDDDRELAAGYRATLATAHGQYIRAVPLMTQSATPAGYLIACEGQPSWILMMVRTGDVSGDYAVRLITHAGQPIPLGTMSVAHGQGTWGATISTSVDHIAAVTLTRPSALAITARLG